MSVNEEYLGRCKQTLYFKRHKVEKTPDHRGYRCKYCDKLFGDLLYERRIKKVRAKRC